MAKSPPFACYGISRRRITIGGLAAFLSSAAAFRRVQSREAALLRIGGTGMALATMQQIGDAFTAAYPEVSVKVLPSLGTGGGLAAVTAGAIDLALSARPSNETDAAKGLQSFAYARTPIAFVTHPDVAVHAITQAEVAQIFTGRMLAWPDGSPIRLIRREPSDADWSMLRDLSSDMAEAVRVALGRPGLLTVATDQDNADALERLRGSFGAMSLGQLRAENRRVMPLVLDGAPPTVEALAAGHYALSRTLYVVWRDQPSLDIARFLAFLHGSQAGELLTRFGHIPLADPDA